MVANRPVACGDERKPRCERIRETARGRPGMASVRRENQCDSRAKARDQPGPVCTRTSRPCSTWKAHRFSSNAGPMSIRATHPEPSGMGGEEATRMFLYAGHFPFPDPAPCAENSGLRHDYKWWPQPATPSAARDGARSRSGDDVLPRHATPGRNFTCTTMTYMCPHGAEQQSPGHRPISVNLEIIIPASMRCRTKQPAGS